MKIYAKLITFFSSCQFSKVAITNDSGLVNVISTFQNVIFSGLFLFGPGVHKSYILSSCRDI